ncbi:hypothetical protein PAMP_021358 [Pampus punctatissimus]
MEDNVGDALRCEEQLKTSLHCDDKEKTAADLLTFSPLSFVGSWHCYKGNTTGQLRNYRRSQVIRFLLPTDIACPSTPDSGHGAARGHRPSSALRLRSRRSRLRWERRSAEAGRSTDNSEEGHEQSERMECKTERQEETGKSEGTEVVHEGEELFSESPSLLLSHWNAQETGTHTETGEMQEGEGKREKEAEMTDEGNKDAVQVSLLPMCRSPAIHTEEGKQDFTENQGNKETQGGEEGVNSRLGEENSNNDTVQHAGEKIDTEQTHDMEIKEEKSGMGEDEKDVSLLASCTLVEGLLFPAEYYVRTTRRMTSSQSQPDMQAIILSQLSMGRRRRSRGRGLERHTHNDERSHQHTDCPHMQSHAADTSDELAQSSSEIPDQFSVSETNMDAFSSPAVCTAGAGRGSSRRRRRRGRGRGRLQTLRCSHHVGLEQSSDDHQHGSTSISSNVSLHGADRLKSCLTSEETVPVLDEDQPASTHSSEVNGAQSSPASGQQGKVYPIFLQSSDRTHRSTQRNTNDQFASLKLHKLRQVTVESGVEHFSSPSYNTRGSNRRFGICYSGDPVTPLMLPLSLTPTIEKSPHPTKEKETPWRTPGEQQTDTSSTQPAVNCVDKYTEQDPVTLNTHSQSSVSASVTHRPAGHPLKSQTSVNFADKPSGDKLKIKQTASEEQTDFSGVIHHSEDQSSVNHQNEDAAFIKTLSFSDFPPQESPEGVSNSCTDAQACSDPAAPGESPVKLLKSGVRDLKGPSEPTTRLITDGLVENKNKEKCLPSQLLLSPRQAFITPHLPSPVLLSSPTLPSLGLTPQPVAAALTLTSSPSAPSLTLPPPYSPSTQALSPPALSPCASLPPLSPSAQIQAASDVQVQMEAAGEHMSFTHTLKPVISVFPVPDAAGLMCVTLASHKRRCVRASSRLLWVCPGPEWSAPPTQRPVPVCKCLRCQTPAAIFKSSASTSLVFISTQSSQPLTSPGVSVGAIAPVDGLSDALIGTDEGGCLFVWNLKTGQLLRRIVLGDGLSHTACLRGYSCCGALLVLLQHHFLSSLEEEEKEAKVKDQMFVKEEERKRTALFSLVAVNPLSGKSVLATRLYAPKAWSGRLCEADVNSSSVVGLSQSGCVCVWELGRRGDSRMVWAPESEGWQLARWGTGDTLVTGHHNGDVTLHSYRTSQTSQTLKSLT